MAETIVHLNRGFPPNTIMRHVAQLHINHPVSTIEIHGVGINRTDAANNIATSRPILMRSRDLVPGNRDSIVAILNRYTAAPITHHLTQETSYNGQTIQFDFSLINDIDAEVNSVPVTVLISATIVFSE